MPLLMNLRNILKMAIFSPECILKCLWKHNSIRNRTSRASQPQKSVTFQPHPGGRPRSPWWTCGGIGKQQQQQHNSIITSWSVDPVVVIHNTGNLALQTWTPVGHIKYLRYQQNMETWDVSCHHILDAVPQTRDNSDEHQQTKISEYVLRLQLVMLNIYCEFRN
jgi:hypothetical protein